MAQSNLASEQPASEKPRARAETPGAAWLPTALLVLGVCVFHSAYLLEEGEKGLWVPAIGIGIALVAWGGLRFLAILAIDAVIVNYLLYPDDGAVQALLDGLFLTGQIGLGWWIYRDLAGGSKRLDDPRSATLFLILVPGVVAAVLAGMQALCWQLLGTLPRHEPTNLPWALLAASRWVSAALGTLIPAPILLVAATPWLVRHRWLRADPSVRQPGGSTPQDWTWGEIIETAGLAIGNGIFAVVLVHTQQAVFPHWTLWGIALLLVVWGSLRQGLRGGTLIAGFGATLALVLATGMNVPAGEFGPLQGNLLAQCSAVLLVGASSGWIRASEARYRQVVGHIPVVLYSAHLPRSLKVKLQHHATKGKGAHDPDLATGPLVVAQAEVTLVSSAGRQVFGCDPDTLLGPYSDWLQRIHEPDRELVRAAVAQLCLQKEPISCEYRLDPAFLPPLPQSSSWANVETFRWVRDTMAPNYTADGLLAGWEGVVEDITEQQALSLRLKRTSNMLQALITNLPAGIFFVQGQAGYPILVNARARQLLGQREDRAAGIAYLPQVYRLHRPDGSLYPADELPVAMALRLGTTHMVNDIVIHHPDGRRVPLITWAAPVDLSGNGKPDAAVWVLEDMSALQQAESARRESESRLRMALDVLQLAKEKFQNLVETLPLMVLQINAVGQITFLNHAAEQMTGYATEELQQPGVWESLLSPEELTQFQTGVARSRAGYHARVEFRFKAKDGSTKVGHALMQPFLQDGKAQGSTCLIVDMTLQRFLEAELQRAQQLELMGRLAGGTVHDFNNLLTVMVGMANLAQSSVEPSHPVFNSLRRISEVGEQAGHLAGQILAFGKHQRAATTGPVDLNAVVAYCLKMLESVLPGNIRVESRLEENVLVTAEETQLKQIIVNLCLNARDAMPQGGSLVVRVEREEEGEKGRRGEGEAESVADSPSPLLPSSPSSAMVRLTVQDTGEGMEESVLKNIFEPFFSTKERGTGLGLTVVRQIVESFGGRIHATSKPGEGTSMTVLLPEAGET